MVKPPLPVHFQIHLLTFIQRWAYKVYGFGTLPHHPQHRDVSDESMVIWLKEDNTKPVQYLHGRWWATGRRWVIKSSSHLPSSLRKQDGVLERHIKALQSFCRPIDFLLELSWTAGHDRRNKLEGKFKIRRTFLGFILTKLKLTCTDNTVLANWRNECELRESLQLCTLFSHWILNAHASY